MAIQWERKEQAWLVQWCRLKYPNVLIVASANGGTRNIKEAANMKREGVTAGMPDLAIYRANHGHHGLFIELKDPGSKTRQKGRLSTVQTNMLNKLNGEGYYAVCCWGWIQAKEVINWYLEVKDEPAIK